MLDDQDMRFLDDSWVNGQIATVSQGFGGIVILDGKTLWDNVAAGILGDLMGYLCRWGIRKLKKRVG